MSPLPLSPELEFVVSQAAQASPLFATTAPSDRARALVAVADALETAAPQLIEIAQRETGLTAPRLTGELRRTAVQLRLFADTIVEGSYLDARVDVADPDFVLGARPDLRRMLIPVGPVINFSASNFPFAFSVLGGDTASALASGCPVIVKAHSGHPKLSDATARLAQETLVAAGMPAGILQLIHGREAGTQVLKDPRIKAGSFTGSIAVGRLLADVAASRPAPIPFFGELGSVNPVFVLPEAVAERANSIAEGLLASISGSAGQLCTKPGIVFIPEETVLSETFERMADDPQLEHRMLDQRIAHNFSKRQSEILSTPGVKPLVVGGVRFDASQHGWATPTIARVSLADFRAHHSVLAEEAFGPLTILVEVPATESLASLVPEFFEGNLTGTLHLGSTEAAGTSDNSLAIQALVFALSQQVGRVLFNGWPTGVAVSPAQQHGGPWPATTNDSSTSVGTAAISRFLRPVAFQDAPDAYLPLPLASHNPLDVPRTVAPAGVSASWGELAPGAL